MTDKEASVVVVKQVGERMQAHRRRIKMLRSKLRESGFAKVKELSVGSRQLGNLKDDIDVFASEYSHQKIISPEYSPSKLYRIVEESSVLPKNIDAMVSNIPGFGYEYQWIGEGSEPSGGDADRDAMESIVTQANETESFLSVRRAVRRDIESTGNGYYEITRLRNKEIAMIYHSKAIYTRIAPLDKSPVKITVKMQRGGREIPVTIIKRFRKYAFMSSTGSKIRWFKEFGDPRNMSYKTGEYNSSTYQATEMLHIPCKRGATLYGQPRWIGNILSVMGVRDSDFINYDIFQNQGIPPFVVMVSGGMLTAESIDELEDLFMSAKGKVNFNKIAILEAEDTSGQIDADNRAKIEIKSLVEYRKEDAMFRQYSRDANTAVREAFRLPPIYVGNADDYSYSTSKTSRLMAEENIFRPERNKEDELINNTIFSNINNWKLITKGPEIIRSDELATMFAHITNSGAITINNAIEIVRRLFDLKIDKSAEPWADIPIMIVRQLAKAGVISVPDGIKDENAFTVPDIGYDKEPDPVGYNLDEENASK